MRPLRFFLLVLIALVAASAAHAARVRDLVAVHRSGQTFLTWTVPADGGYTYRVYSSTRPIRRGADLEWCVFEGEVGDSTWLDRRLSALRGQTFAFARDSAGPPLSETEGMFVSTTALFGFRYYGVTATADGEAEDRTMVYGINTTTRPVVEQYARPRPVWQRQLDLDGTLVDDYVLWASNHDTPYLKATTNLPCFPFHCGIVRPVTSGPGAFPAPPDVLFLGGHGRGGSFLDRAVPHSTANWNMTFDDYLPNKDVASFWFGYHEGYDPLSNQNPPPATGRVRGYTHARVVHLIDWAVANFPVDPTRVYAWGHSMGGSFAVFLSLTAGDKLAAAWANVPKVDLADYRGTGLYPAMFEPMWGSTEADLPTDQGLPVYERLRAATLAGLDPAREVPPILSFSGRFDYTVGWPEKIPFYQAVEQHRLGGRHFWDQRGHYGPGGLEPEGFFDELYRFRRDRSWPALSNASCNGDPGSGDPATGDSLGSINGCVDWDDSTLVEYADRWEVVLRPRTITTTWGTLPAPDFLTVDVTPRRLQKFRPAPGTLIEWQVKRLPEAEVVLSGEAMVDAFGRVTVPAVPVHAGGSQLRLRVPGVAGVGTITVRRPVLAIDRAIVVGRAGLSVAWPGAGEGSLALYDVGGRRLHTYRRGPVHGRERVEIDARGLPPGVFFVRAEQGGHAATARFVVLH